MMIARIIRYEYFRDMVLSLVVDVDPDGNERIINIIH